MEQNKTENITPDISPRSLPRVLGLTSIIGIVVGTIIGSGIFIVPSSVAAQVRKPSLMLLVWVVGGVLSFCGAISVSELGAAFPQAGGTYVFLREAYGPLIAFLFGWALFLIIDAGSVATLAVAFSSNYLPYFIKLTPLGSKLVSVLLIALLALINCLGVKKGAFVQNLLTVFKLVAIVGVSVIAFVFAKGSASHFSSAGQASTGGLLGAFGVALVGVLWAYKGWEMATFSAGELKNPEKTLPLGIFIGTVLVIALYLIANVAYLYAVPAGEMAKSSRIAADVMQIALGPVGASILAVMILFSITGAANGHLLTGPRVYYAMAKDGLFFKKFTDIHPKFLTPYASIIALALWSSILSFSGTFEKLFTYVVFGLWIFMGLAVAGVFILRKKRPDLPRPYKTWGYPVTPALFVLASLYISVNTLINKFWNSFWGLAIILLGIPAFLYWRNKNKKSAA